MGILERLEGFPRPVRVLLALAALALPFGSLLVGGYLLLARRRQAERDRFIQHPRLGENEDYRVCGRCRALRVGSSAGFQWAMPDRPCAACRRDSAIR
jgi:hypothetical protein